MKKLIVALGLFASIGLTSAITLNRGFVQVRAEDESSESISESESSESIIESYSDESESETVDESDGFFAQLSQGAKDFLVVAKEILNQPIVIGGVSVTLGAIVLWVVGKLFGIIGKKKLAEYGNKIDELFVLMNDSIKKKDYNELAKQTEQLTEVCKILVDGTRNVKVKEQAQLALKDFQPVIEDNKEFVINETKMVVDDGKKQLDKTAQDIVGIVNQD